MQVQRWTKYCNLTLWGRGALNAQPEEKLCFCDPIDQNLNSFWVVSAGEAKSMQKWYFWGQNGL